MRAQEGLKGSGGAKPGRPSHALSGFRARDPIQWENETRGRVALRRRGTFLEQSARGRDAPSLRGQPNSGAVGRRIRGGRGPSKSPRPGESLRCQSARALRASSERRSAGLESARTPPISPPPAVGNALAGGDERAARRASEPPWRSEPPRRSPAWAVAPSRSAAKIAAPDTPLRTPAPPRNSASPGLCLNARVTP